MFPAEAEGVRYEVRPRSGDPGDDMVEIWIDGQYRWLIHRKIRSATDADQPDPKKWFDPATGTWMVNRHGELHFCDECPEDKRHVPARTREHCPLNMRGLPA